MIELNLTYEESKKILELGYDFSKVCWKSQYSYNQEVLLEHTHGTGLPLSSIEYRVKYEVDKYGIATDITPIIPEAALEKCLPDYSFIDAANRKLSCRWYGHIPICNEAYALNNIHLHHKSGYEAFMWVHENYPEELKKKFDEVMA